MSELDRNDGLDRLSVGETDPVAGAASAAPCGDCGHARSWHTDVSVGESGCMARTNYGFCICWRFIPEAEATPEMKARRVFGRTNWHSVYTFKEPFQPGEPCNHDGCASLTTIRIMVNIWGTVCEYDVCEEHRSYHGKLLDEFRAKRHSAPTSPANSGTDAVEDTANSKEEVIL